MFEWSSHLVWFWAVNVVFITLARAQVNNVTGACAAGAQFTVFEASLEFQEAVDFCALQGGTLARIGNSAEHFRVVDLIVASSFKQDFWIGKRRCHKQSPCARSSSKIFVLGLFDPPPNDGNLAGNTERFVFVDGNTDNRDFFLDPFEFPWDEREPGDGFGNSNCVRWICSCIIIFLQVLFV